MRKWRAGHCVAWPRRRRVQHVGRHVRRLLHPSCALQPLDLVGGDGGVDARRARLGEAARQHDGVLDGDVGALSVVRDERVRGVAEKHDAAVGPPSQRWPAVQRPAAIEGRSADHLDDGGVPSFEVPEVLVRFGRHRPVVDVPRESLHQQEVDRRAVATNRVVQQVAVWSDPELDRRGVGEAREILHGDDATEAAATRVDLVVVPDHELSDQGPGAVGTDDDVRLHLRAVGEVDRDLVTLLRVADDLLAEVDALAPYGVREDLLQVGAVHAVPGRSVPARLRLVVPRDDVPVAPVAVDESRRLPRHSVERVPKTEPLDEARGVGGQVHRGSDLAQLGRPFVDLRVHPALAEGEGEAEPSHACPDDRDAHPRIVHLASP